MAKAPEPRRRLGLAIAAAGLLAIIFGGLQAADLRSRLGPIRLLVAPSAIAVTSDGTVLVGSPPLSKVHVYASSGRPLRTWLVPTDGAPFRMALAAANRLQIAPARAGTLLEYTLEGELLSSREDTDAWERLDRDDDLSFSATTGARYTIEGGRVVRSEAGRRQVLVDGFASHAELRLQIVRVVALLLGGAIALLGGVLMTASRGSPC